MSAPEPPVFRHSSGRMTQTACDKCTFGVLDTKNPHWLGTCECECHLDTAPAFSSADDWVALELALLYVKGEERRDKVRAALGRLRERNEQLTEAVDAFEEYYAHVGGEHYWRCEYRTVAMGWKHGSPPIIRCQCGLERLTALRERLINSSSSRRLGQPR